MSIDPDLDHELVDIVNPHLEETKAEQPTKSSVRWNEIWFLLVGFSLLFGLVAWMLLIAPQASG
ncbi:hypothetical protein JQK15_15465 [Sphingobium sp. BHU LFT2]|uniref:hypothetical protein n=1 Tax=Sphingobium sp. BHU LFT2 TaxID=2807634 RepID=UPI001BECAFB8|nr:hypothetical protein [Sphingobium sp. BHU LFT2]MBT2244941.1 hypothetical protein [Sphingobium sp. BHU LFT2]